MTKSPDDVRARPGPDAMRSHLQLGHVDTPIGPLTVATRGGRVCLLYFDGADRSARAALTRWYPGEQAESVREPAGIADVLRRYFAGEIHALDDVDVELNGTGFQQQVWRALRQVQAGQTASYSAIARRIGSVASVRAVGAANGANPIALIVPCHRVIGANGSLTGYGGGLKRKEWLLRHEGVPLPQRFELMR